VTAKLDPLIHPITRLSICRLLAAGADPLTASTLAASTVTASAQQWPTTPRLPAW
jgi:hypothetical protein